MVLVSHNFQTGLRKFSEFRILAPVNSSLNKEKLPPQLINAWKMWETIKTR